MAEDDILRLVLLGPLYPYRGGIAHFIESIYEGMNERGHEVKAVTFSRQYPNLLFPGKTQYEETQRQGADVAPRMIDTLNPVTWLRSAAYVRAMSPHLVVFKYWMPFFAPSFGTIARRLRKHGIRSVAIVDNAIPHERRPGDRALTRYALNACSGLIAMSESVVEDLRELRIRPRIEYARHPTYDLFGERFSRDEARKRLDVGDEVPLLLFFGFVRRYKGLHLLLEAMPAILERRPDTQLIVAGEFYEPVEAYTSTIAKLGLGQNVRIVNRYIADNEVALFFGAADVVVQPYVSATQSGVAQIAFHFERPVIVTDVGGLAEMVPHEQAGLVVPSAQAGPLARAVIRFFDEDLFESLRQGVVVERAKYSWGPFLDTLESFARG